MHLADAFIQSDLLKKKNIFYQYVCSLGIEPTTFCAVNAMLYHWATGTHINLLIISKQTFQDFVFKQFTHLNWLKINDDTVVIFGAALHFIFLVMKYLHLMSHRYKSIIYIYTSVL